ncbi:metallophosphoesterase [Hymenobacter roseosalivarius DSM 11622]|uniref:Metallophosphoesterase n=1 Tax=Hymenobacter roseosalivarius DSM 11622 TaxID=645990 RepID=A0A1W1V9E2_9BACT|nr:metallophosphoesterase [Hymenobacter roseosalivarius]SMB89876.1 metallophosphoesterase [Hymenobacter roseosalivarius DSM 11622]
METYVLGDIHGAFRALEQVLERSPFRPGIDRLIHLGDISDGWPDTPECVERLHSIPNSIWLQGNHDWWTAEWMTTELPRAEVNMLWYQQGGKATYDAYERGPKEQIGRHFRTFFAEQRPYFEDEAGNLYVHGGYHPRRPIAEQEPYDLVWNRMLWNNGMQAHAYTECFIGHTPTWPASAVPCQRANVWNIDQGAAYGGLLSLLNVRTKEFVQSDTVQSLYPGVKGR